MTLSLNRVSVPALTGQWRTLCPLQEALMNNQIGVVSAGNFIARKVRQQVSEGGAFRAARNLKKQGYPLAVALLLIVGRV